MSEMSSNNSKAKKEKRKKNCGEQLLQERNDAAPHCNIPMASQFYARSNWKEEQK
jgi:hypothetical protein